MFQCVTRDNSGKPHKGNAMTWIKAGEECFEKGNFAYSHTNRNTNEKETT